MSSNACFLLGAGFSRAASEAMPTLAQLQPAVLAELGIEENVLHGFGDNLEQWMSFLSVDQPWLPHSENLRNRAMFADASQAVERCISSAEKAALNSPMPVWAQRLTSTWHENESTIVSFNYDTLIERAASEQRRIFNWSDLYWLPITRRSEPGLFPTANTPTDRLATLFKLHGSTNCAFSGPEGSSTDPVFVVRSAGRWHDDIGAVSQKSRRAARYADVVPLIIPPTVTKGSFYSNRALRAQWQEAARRLSAADELIIIGYSFPLSDISTQHFLTTSLEVEVPVTIVDYSPESADRIEQMLGPTHQFNVYAGASAVADYVETRCGDLVVWGAKEAADGLTPFIEINGQHHMPCAADSFGGRSREEAFQHAENAVERMYPGLAASGIDYWYGERIDSRLAITPST